MLKACKCNIGWHKEIVAQRLDCDRSLTVETSQTNIVILDKDIVCDVEGAGV